MRLEEVLRIVEARPVWDAEYDDPEIRCCYASDLISDVLTFHGPSALLLTGLTNAQVMRTAESLDFVAICFVRDKGPQPETIELSKEMGLPLFVTSLTMYESCGRLYERKLPGTTRRESTNNCLT